MPRRTLRTLSLIVPLLGAQFLQGATVPRQAPSFSISMPDKTKMPLSKFKGKTVLLAFILTHCSDCQNFTRLLIKLQSEFGPKGLQAIESAIEENAEPAVPGFVRTYQPSFPVGFNRFDDAVEFLQHPKGAYLYTPMIAVIDRQGMIVAQYQASDEFMGITKVEQNLRGLLQKLVGNPAGKSGAKAKEK